MIARHLLDRSAFASPLQALPPILAIRGEMIEMGLGRVTYKPCTPSRPAIATRRCRNAIVVGAGVVGVATAYALARRGLAVTVIDEAAEAGRATSHANGAQLSYAYTDALGNPDLLARLPHLAFGKDPAFRLRASIDPGFAAWIIRFIANCGVGSFRRNTLEGIALGIQSRIAMHDLLQKHPLDFLFSKPGKLHLFEREDVFRAARDVMILKRGVGAVQTAVDPAEAVRIEPALAGIEGRLVGAIYSPDDEVGDPYRFCAQLLDVLCRQYQARVLFGAKVRSIDVATARPTVVTATGLRLEADAVAVCAGNGTRGLLSSRLTSLPIWPMKGYSLTAPFGASPPRVSVTDVSRKIVFCRLGDRIRIAGLAELGAFGTEVDQARIATLLAGARASLPDAAAYDHAHSPWAGLRPMTPDSLPIVKKIGKSSVVNAGHGALGWTYAMGCAERTAALLLSPMS